MKILTRSQLFDLITEISASGASAVSLVMNTVPDIKKKNRITKGTTPSEYFDIRKVSYVNGFLNFDYQNSVNRQLEREGQEADFKVQSAWFEHVTGDARPIVRQKADHSKIYVQVKCERVLDAKYILPNGDEVDSATLADYLPLPSKPKNQGTEKPIITFTVSLDNVTSFTAKGETYTVAGSVKAPSSRPKVSAMVEGRNEVGDTGQW
jgi:hypothetical protein